MRNLVILAHVDAGKTTLTERILSVSGAIRTPGAVDEGTAHTDRLAVERRRGISVAAAGAALNWKGEEITLIDTPGHSDFSAETERALWAADGAVLVISAAEGVQPQTEALFDALVRAKIPALLFFNKTDRDGADADGALEDFRALLSPDAVPMWDGEKTLAFLAERDDGLLEKYLGGQTPDKAALERVLRAETQNMRAFPALRGSALKGEGVEALLDAAVSLLPGPAQGNGRLCAKVFAVTRDDRFGKMTHVRVYSGTLACRDAVTFPLPGEGEEKTGECKVTQLRRYTPDGKGRDTPELRAGEIGMAAGLSFARPGDELGDISLLPLHAREAPGTLRAPLLSVRANAESGKEHALFEALGQLSQEDPLLSVAFDPNLKQTVITVMGKMQLEILSDTLLSRFGLNVSFEPPRVVYKETVSAPCEGFVSYTMPKPCWAVIRLYVEPAPRGTGVRFESAVTPKTLPIRYQRQIGNALPRALRQGPRGFEVTDVKVTLIGGEHHEIHTHPLDFLVATPMAVMDALGRGGTKLLEPILRADFYLPGEMTGKVMSDVEKMRGQTLSVLSLPRGNRARLLCEIPVATSLDYPDRLIRETGGRGGMTARLIGYRDAPPETDASAPRRGVDPRDTSKYILAARSALDGGIFDF